MVPTKSGYGPVTYGLRCRGGGAEGKDCLQNLNKFTTLPTRTDEEALHHPTSLLNLSSKLMENLRCAKP